jgi:dTDP-glucose 4,6-dehydratase
MPLTIAYALAGKAVPIYGDGKQIRDWLYVTDHCQALIKVLDGGKIGDTYNIGGNNEKSNLEIVTSIFTILDKIKPLENENSYSSLMSFVADRPGHDRRYAINAEKIRTKLNWQPSTNFDVNLLQTVSWYLENEEWLEGAIKSN